MLITWNRCTAVAMLVCLWSVTASAQTGGLTGTGTQTAGPDDTPGIISLDQDAAFSAIERDEVVGATAETGRGFSDLSVANTGNRAIGGLGGLGGGLGGFGGLGGLFQSFGQGGQQSTTRPAIRTRLRSAIEVERRPVEYVERVAGLRFQSLANRPQLNGIQVTMRGRTAVISGQVGHERHRRMSELLMRLEPGVGEVENRVVVMPQ